MSAPPPHCFSCWFLLLQRRCSIALPMLVSHSFPPPPSARVPSAGGKRRARARGSGRRRVGQPTSIAFLPRCMEHDRVEWNHPPMVRMRRRLLCTALLPPTRVGPATLQGTVVRLESAASRRSARTAHAHAGAARWLKTDLDTEDKRTMNKSQIVSVGH